jgi:tetratricopeptide (TPR) repeat protein
LGHVAAAEGGWDRALALFEQAAERDPSQRVNVVLSRLALGLRAADRGRWTEAEQQLERANSDRALLQAEDAARLEYARAVTALNLEQYGTAERRFTDALRQLERVGGGRRRLPSDASLRIDLRLAYAHYRNGNHAQAVTLLERMRGSSEASEELRASAYERLSREAYERGELREARRHLEQAIASAPRNAIARNNLACLMYGEGDVHDAGRIFAELADDGAVEAAILNYAIYLDAHGNDPEIAYRYYLRYAARGGEQADAAREQARIKQQVFGFDPDG